MLRLELSPLGGGCLAHFSGATSLCLKYDLFIIQLFVLAFPNNIEGASISSHIGGRPGGGCSGSDLGVSSSGIGELSVVVLLEEACLDSVGYSQEVGVQLGVGQVHVEVVLEVLKHVHVLLNESVSSNSGEGESLVKELPSVNVHLGGLASGRHLLGNVVSIGPVTGIKSSREHVDLIVELGLSLIKISARLTKLDEGILDTIDFGLNKVGLNLDSGGSQEHHS